MALFIRYYKCPCGTEWEDEWDNLCDDRCPTCNTSCEPHDHAEIDQTPEDKKPNMGVSFILLIRKNDICV